MRLFLECQFQLVIACMGRTRKGNPDANTNCGRIRWRNLIGDFFFQLRTRQPLCHSRIVRRSSNLNSSWIRDLGAWLLLRGFAYKCSVLLSELPINRSNRIRGTAVELAECLAVTSLPGAISALSQLNGAHTRRAVFAGFYFCPCCCYSAHG